MMLGLVFGIMGTIVLVTWRTIRREERQRLERERLLSERGEQRETETAGKP